MKIAFFPDTQYEVEYLPDVLSSMCSFISSQKPDILLCSGDITSAHSQNEFSRAVSCFNSIYSAGVPFVPCIGNHDYDDTFNRSAATYNSYFGNSWWSNRSYLGGHYSDGYENIYCIFDIGSEKVLVLSLELFPSDAVIIWAQMVIDANLDRKVILITHGYLNPDGTRTLQLGSYGPSLYCVGNDGKQLWDKLIFTNENIFLVLCGHQIFGSTSCYRRDHNYFGKDVHQVFCNHQQIGGGEGYIMLFDFQDHYILATTYSPYLDAFDPSGSYTLDYNYIPVGDNCILKIS